MFYGIMIYRPVLLLDLVWSYNFSEQEVREWD